jgi:protein-S-isoprenylcysteine O-methyltransferase Ste14
MDTPPPEDAPLSLKSARLAVAMEKLVLPWLYVWLAYQRFSAALEDYHGIKRLARFRSPYPNMQELLYAQLTKNALLFFLIALYGGMLLLSRPVTVLPTRRKHLLVPLAMSSYFVLYGMLDYLPPSLRDSLLPPALQFPCAMGGVLLSVIGYSIAIWAIFYLRRSFAIFVSVRRIVSKGPYAYTRHPIYLGYLFDSCGIALASFSIAILFLGCGFVWLLVERARMEEEKLCEASDSYRMYARRTGFLFPRFREIEIPPPSPDPKENSSA